MFEVDKSEPAGPGAPQGPCVPEALRVAIRAWCTKRNRSRSRCGDSAASLGFQCGDPESCSYDHLPVISTYNPIYRMYNPIYNQLL